MTEWKGPLSSTNVPALRNQTIFWHDIEIFNWQTRINYQKSLFSKWEIEAAEDLSSALQQQSRGDVWKDDQYGSLRLRRSLPRGWVETRATSKIFRDDFTNSTQQSALGFHNNDFSLSRLELRSELLLANRLRVAPGAGYRWENILNRNDYGPHGELGMALLPVVWSDYTHQLEAEAQIDRTSDRRNDDLGLSYSVSRQFENNASDSLFVRYDHYRRENYFADPLALFVDLQSRDTRSVENRLQYAFSGWQMQLRTGIRDIEVDVARRQIDSATPASEVSRFDHQDFEVDHEAVLTQQARSMRHEIALTYSQRHRTYRIPDSLRAHQFIRRYASEGYDSDDWDLVLAHRWTWQIGAKDSLRWYGRAVRRAHDTGNQLDPNDYDQLQFQASLLYEHRFDAYFRIRWQSRAYLEHQVYLKSNLSGDNRWMRIWQLSPQVLFDPHPAISLRPSFGVRATFIDYDFPEAVSNRKSIIFRDFFIADSMTARLTPTTTASLQYKFALEERGLLDWDRWLQSPQIDIHRTWVALRFMHQLARQLTFAPGVSYYHESNWKFNLRPGEGIAKSYSNGRSIVSPTLEVSYIRPPHVVITFRGRRQMSYRIEPGDQWIRSGNIDTFHLIVQWAL